VRVGISERFGAPGHDLAHVARIAAAVEARGFDSFWAPEHLVVLRGEAAAFSEQSATIELSGAPSFPDPFLTLTAVAAATTRLLLGTAVLLVPLHHPLAIARAGATLDALSGGRFVLGAGVGWQPQEYAAMGVPWEGRGARASEHLEAVRTLWSERPASFSGPNVSFEGVLAEPRPLSRPHPPILVGGNSEAALLRAASLGDGWFGWGLDADGLQRAHSRLLELLAAGGREPHGFTIQLGARFDRDGEQLARLAERARSLGLDRLVVSCAPERPIDELQLDAIALACEPLGGFDRPSGAEANRSPERPVASPASPRSTDGDGGA
jgi:probable F420-dependent oxidoreductase